MPVNMLEYTKTFAPGTMERAFIETFAAESDVMRACPIKSATDGKHTFFRTARLPTPAFRALNAQGIEVSGSETRLEDGVYFTDHYIKVDRAKVDNFGPQHRARQEKMAATALSQDWTRTFLKGSNTSSNGLEPDGLQARCTVLDKSLFHNSASSGGAALSLTNLDRVVNAVRKRTHIIAPYGMKYLFDAALRSTTVTGFNQAPDPLDPARNIMHYKGIPILWGYEPDDSPPILPFEEVATGGGAAVTTSIYVVSFSDEGVCGIEGTPLQVRDEGILQGQPFYSTHVKWDFGFTVEHPNAAARLTSITNAAIVF